MNMDGNAAFENEYERKLNVILNKNPDKKYLRGFANHISDRAASTIRIYVTNVAMFMNKTNKAPEDLTLEDYDEMLASIKKCTSSYQITMYTALKEFSNYLKAAKINMDDPMQYKKRPKFKESKETQIKRENGYLTSSGKNSEISRFLNTVDSGIGTHKAKERQKEWRLRDRLIIHTLLNTGMRSAALWKLNVNDVDFEKKQIISVDKGAKTFTYDLNDSVLELMEAWIIDRNQKIKVKGVPDDGALFISNRMKRMSQLAIADVVKKYSVTIKGKHITPHKLRATAITTVYEKSGGNLYMAQQFAGHSNPKITEIYIRGQKNTVRKNAADIMGNIINH